MNYKIIKITQALNLHGELDNISHKMKKIDLSSLPSKPGCYLFKDWSDYIIYIGKAKNLKKRVSTYFQKRDHDSKTLALIQNIDSMDFIVTDNEVEALLLERNLIRKHQPRYNIDLKDSKSYAYLLVTNEEFPRIVIARNRNLKGDYYGPFVSAQQRTYVREIINKTFQLRTCKRMPKKACLRYHIKLCKAPCINAISNEEYMVDLEKAKVVLKGGANDLVLDLESEMKKMSESQNFEKALELREQISSLQRLSERQKMERHKKYDEDVINYVVRDGKVYLLLFNVYKGILIEKHEFVFEYNEDFFSEFLVQFYSENDVPKEVIVPEDAILDTAITGYLEKLRGNKVIVTVPKIGTKKKLLDLVETNIESSFFADLSKLEDLMKKLKLNEIPEVIECFDISHLSGTSMVGSMVQFRGGRPDKNNYRRFKIKTVEGIDDFAAISEVVMRRYKRLRDEELDLPNLIVIDGGKGQLSSAIESLRDLGVKVPIVSLAKRLEEVYVPGLSKPLRFDMKSKAVKLLQNLRDEAHRFAITYNRLLRSKEALGK